MGSAGGTSPAEAGWDGLEPRVVVGGDAVHLFLDRVADSEAFDEVVDGLLRDGSVGARELLQCFVGLGVAFATEDRLKSFGYDGPVVLEILVEGILVEEYLPETLAQALQGDEAVCQGYTDIAQYRGVGEVTLQARDGELASEEAIDGVRDAEVTLCILEVNGVDLVRHS